MSPEQILAALSQAHDELPTEALHAAADHRDALVDPLLQALRGRVERSRGGVPPDEDSETLADIAMYLLAQFRETRAFPLFADLCRLDEARSDEWVGDMLNLDLPSFLASTCGGDPQPLIHLAEEPGLHLYARWSALDALLVLVAQGAWSRTAMISWLQQVWAQIEALHHEDLAMLIHAVYTLGAAELLPQVRRAYAEDRHSLDFVELQDVEAACTNQAPPLVELAQRNHSYIDDAASSMAWQYHGAPESHFDEDFPPDGEFDDDFEDDFLPQVTYVRPEPKIGRNDPCPCGSGRKYKKCCLRGDTGETQELAVRQ